MRRGRSRRAVEVPNAGAVTSHVAAPFLLFVARGVLMTVISERLVTSSHFPPTHMGVRALKSFLQERPFSSQGLHK